MEFFLSKDNPSFLPQVEGLVFGAFGRRKLPPVDFHCCLLEGDQLTGYAALSDRIIRFENEKLELLLLGFVTVRRDCRRRGNGSFLMNRIIERVKADGHSGIILNTGENVLPFYGKLGFRKISERAEYLRNGALQMDHDPVMILPFCDRLLKNQWYEKIIMGTDF
jgi:predicted N-acetyltransferase YhbS